MARREAGVLRDRAAAARKAFNRADALVELAQGYLRGDRPDHSPIEVTLTVPASVLRDELTDPVEVGELGEGFVSREAVRRLSCDAGVVEIIEEEQGTPLSVGRKRRTIAGSLRRALQRRDHSCTYPGCTNRLFLEGHHIRHWADGGETSLSNAVLLCSIHHRHVHELGYTVELGPDQRARFRDPQGRRVAAVPEPPALADLGWPRIRAANEPLSINAGTIAGPWDGTRVDYARIVGHLATADGLA
jgi:5-methylcytosine-specific restriction endonuclease McrA